MDDPSLGYGKWLNSHWVALLHDAIGLLDTLQEPPFWTFGGGTALAVRYNHRISYDIDLFLKDADALRDLTPARNPATKALLGQRRYDYPGQYLKLRMETGEIDFILAGRRTDAPFSFWRFEEREVRLETPWEIAVKKIFYRPSDFKVRDVFDLAVVVERDGDGLRRNLSEVADKLDRVIHRVTLLAPCYAELAANEVNPTKEGRRYAGEAAALSVLAFLNEFRTSG